MVRRVPLFPVSAKTPGGVDRRTAKMMRVDLKAARKKWTAEAKTEKEQSEREQSDFLAYQDHDGRFADFHSNRHTFITNLERVGVSPRRAQSLARHSDIRLTMGVYTHIGLYDQSAAIELLPAPPAIKKSGKGSSKANGKANGSSPAVPDLGEAWAKLPEKVKAEIVAMVNAAAKE
jgi:hypothetical protein